MRRISFIPEPPIEFGQEKPALVSRGRKSASITLFIRFRSVVFGFLGGQPGDEPGAEESDDQSD